MNVCFIGFDLPSSIKHKLKTFCYGLPSVDWMEEENFQLIVRPLGLIKEEATIEIQDRLSQVSCFPFTIRLKTVSYSRASKREANIWIGAAPIDPILNFKKQIDKELKPFALSPNDRSFKPSVTIGTYETIADQRLAEYLMMNSLYQSENILVSEYSLFQVKTTSKRIYHEKIQSYTLGSSSLTYDD